VHVAAPFTTLGGLLLQGRQLFLRVVDDQPGSREVEQELGNECDASGELLVMFHSDVLASRLERFDWKAIN
jgi:hypothetical protein